TGRCWPVSRPLWTRGSTRSRCAPTRACWLRTCGARHLFAARRSRFSLARGGGGATLGGEPIALLADEIRSLAPRFALLHYRWVPEAENGAAHRLAQLAPVPRGRLCQVC